MRKFLKVPTPSSVCNRECCCERLAELERLLDAYALGAAVQREEILRELREHAKRPPDFDESDDSQEDRYWLGYFDAADLALMLAQGAALEGRDHSARDTTRRDGKVTEAQPGHVVPREHRAAR